MAELALSEAELLEQAGFHIQQAAERLLKAVLATANVAYPRTHDLEILFDAVAGVSAAADRHRKVFLIFQPYAALVRYEEGGALGRGDCERALAALRMLETEIRDLVAGGS